MLGENEEGRVTLAWLEPKLNQGRLKSLKPSFRIENIDSHMKLAY